MARNLFQKRVVDASLTAVCPSCKTRGPIRLMAGQVCAACEAQKAWSQLDNGKLVIDQAAVDQALQRRAGEYAGEPVWRRSLAWLMPVVTVAIAARAGWALVHLFTARSISSLGTLLGDMVGTARWATLTGLAAVILGIASLIRMRRGRHFRRLPFIAGYALAVVIGCGALIVGLPGWLFLRHGGFGEYTSMPVRESLGASASAERIVNATVVVIAPDAEGNANAPAIGTGAVIAVDDHRAWIVTCSHVAMPYAGVATFRHARDAQPVWVQLSDGREGKATVRWVAPPPLDVALVVLPIDHPPEPVTIAAETSDVQSAANVTFVPNPYRSGWKVLHGELLRRERHRTPAGTYDLLYTNLPVTFGDSGSGLFDAQGQLIGLNTWTTLGDGASEGISLPSEAMSALVDAIHSGKLDQIPETELAEAPAPARRAE